MPDVPLAQQKRFAKNLNGMSSDELEAEANRLLFGAKSAPKVRDGEHYQAPKMIVKRYVCASCGRPRSKLSASQCLACYRLNSKKRKREREEFDADAYSAMLESGGFENEQRVPITKPDF